MGEVVVRELGELTTTSDALHAAGQAANAAAGRNVFQRYLARKAPNTRTAMLGDLETFRAYLDAVGIPAVTHSDLAGDPSAWIGVTFGLVEAFVEWMLGRGYAVATVNRKLSTVKQFAQMAGKAGAIDPDEMRLIATVSGYGGREGKERDKQRAAHGIPTRIDRPAAKKAEHTPLLPAQARQLKEQPDTPQGRRDAVLMCILLDHGLRASEVAGLQVTDFNLHTGEFTFYRPKVDKQQTHKMTADTWRAVRAWFDAGDAPAMGPLLRGSRKGGTLTGAGMSDRAITARVNALGVAIGIERLSAHDCRHYWATDAARNGTDPLRLQEAGGWASLVMPRHYVEWARVANDGVRLSS